MKKRTLIAGGLIAVAAPWVAAWYLTPIDKVDWACRATYETEYIEGNVSNVVEGESLTNFFPDRTGIARFSGTYVRTEPGKPPIQTTIHRTVKFRYESVGPYLRLVADDVAVQPNDTATTEQVTKYLSPGFTPGNVSLTHTMRITSGAVDFGYRGMPRVHCVGADPMR